MSSRGAQQGHRGRGGFRGGHGSFRGARGGAGAPVQVFSTPGGIPAPDASVTKIEDAIQAAKSTPHVGKLNLQDSFPVRPGYGTRGSSVVLWANYLTLTAPTKLVLRRYHVSVTPEAKGRKLTQIIRLLLQDTPGLAAVKADLVSDFKSTLICRHKLDDQTIEMQYRAEDQDEPSPSATRYKVKILFTNLLALSDLTDYLASTDTSIRHQENPPMIQALNIFLRHYSKSSGNLATIGSSKTFSLHQTSDSWDLGSSLDALRGFFASVRPATARVLVNLNVSHGVFYQEGPLDQFCLRFGPQKGPFKLEAFIKRLRVQTTHLKQKKDKQGKVVPRIKTIVGLANKVDGRGLANPPRVKAFGSGPKDVEFWLEASSPQQGQTRATSSGKKSKSQGQSAATKGRYMTVYDFFANTYGIRIANPDLPVVNVGNRENPVYLPLQVCRVLSGQPAKSRLDPSQAQQMIRFAIRKPAETADLIIKKGLYTAGLSPNTNPLLSQSGITISPNLITVPGRVLAGPKVVYRQNQQVQTMGGSWNMVPRNGPSLKFNSCGSLQRWSCLYIEMPGDYPNAYRFDSNSLNDLVRKFHAVLKDTGMAASLPLQPPQRVQLDGIDDPQLDDTFQRAASSLQLLLVIIPAAPIPLYNRIKQLGDVKYGVHTICSVGSKIAKPQGQDQYFRNEALKFNLKLGGNNQLVDASHLGLISEDKTMVLGIDVTHPSPGSSSAAPSIAGMVASVDRWLGQWPAVLSIQSKSRQEMVSGLEGMLKSRLRLWREKGKHVALPENMLVYRDGVSEGQYQQVLDEELPQLRAACKAVYAPADQAKGLPRLTIVVVGKRHHTRFFPTKEDDSDRSGNSRAGTVVDRGVTEARCWDFFLQAHTALQGTARPAHYSVVLDEMFGPRYAKTPGKNLADELQGLTQSMCYLFGRATKAVSICTPAYYADIVCERARCYLSGLFETPSNSAVPSVAGSVGGGGGGQSGASEQDLQIHERLRDSMFYV